jgi:hypothetical protein
MQMEGLGKLKKFNCLNGNQTHDLPACSIVPQPTINSTLTKPNQHHRYYIAQEAKIMSPCSITYHDIKDTASHLT